MKSFYAYTRVSTQKQGESGVSLQQQKEAIEHYALRNNLSVTQWFEEQETAAKQGRPIFSRILNLLKEGSADGLIVHKIDRSARNLKDWAELGQLTDLGVELHFANESLDLSSRGGRLSADIQAVVAADYIRNLREETKKGYYGRLKQGFCPKPAPIGYLNNGGGKPKSIDPERGPLVRMAFEIYGDAKYSQRQLAEEMDRLGLRTKKGRRLTKTSIAEILSNPFYYGAIRVKKTGDLYQGIHEPLISKPLFDRVQSIMKSKVVRGTRKHTLRFSRFINCENCGRNLIGEVQRGHTYYRCHSLSCPNTSFREEHLESEIKKQLSKLTLNEDELAAFDSQLAEVRASWLFEWKNHVDVIRRQLSLTQTRMDRLADAYLEAAIDRSFFEHKKTAIIDERCQYEAQLREMGSPTAGIPARVEKNVELLKSAVSLYKTGNSQQQRELLEIIMSNRLARGKSLQFTLVYPFSEIANRPSGRCGGPHAATNRTFWKKLLQKLFSLEPQSSDLTNPALVV